MEIRSVFHAHPSPASIEEYAFGRLGADEVNNLEEHLLLCDSCRTSLEETEQYQYVMRTALADYRPPEKRPGFVGRLFERPNRLVWASLASGAVAATLAATMMLPRHPPDPAPVTVTLVSFRGGQGNAMPEAPAKRPLDLALDAGGLPADGAYRIEVVNAQGDSAWNGAARLSRGKLRASLPGILGQGVYWVRLYSSRQSLLYEYGLNLQ